MGKGTDVTELMIRHPRIADAGAIWELIDQTPGLDTNSPYYYSLWCRDFSRFSATAFEDERMVGVLTGYVRPDRLDTYFAWQTAVSANATHSDIAVLMYDLVAASFSANGVNRIEMTIDENNRAVRILLSRLKRRYNATMTSDVLFSTDDLGGEHYPEVLRTLHLPRQSPCPPGSSELAAQNGVSRTGGETTA